MSFESRLNELFRRVRRIQFQKIDDIIPDVTETLEAFLNAHVFYTIGIILTETLESTEELSYLISIGQTLTIDKVFESGIITVDDTVKANEILKLVENKFNDTTQWFDPLYFNSTYFDTTLYNVSAFLNDTLIIGFIMEEQIISDALNTISPIFIDPITTSEQLYQVENSFSHTNIDQTVSSVLGLSVYDGIDFTGLMSLNIGSFLLDDSVHLSDVLHKVRIRQSTTSGIGDTFTLALAGITESLVSSSLMTLGSMILDDTVNLIEGSITNGNIFTNSVWANDSFDCTRSCTGCYFCDSCENCNAVCYACDAVCDVECNPCYNCDSCDGSCQNCNSTCRTCDNCDGSCDDCNNCDGCDGCNQCNASCDTDGCPNCDLKNLCSQSCDNLCESCDNCMECNITCVVCVSCEAACYLVCEECNSCNFCDNCEADT